VRRVLGTSGLTRRVLLASAAVLVLVLVAGAALAGTALQLQRAQRLQTDHLEVAVAADAQALTAFVDEETGLRGDLLTGDPTFLAPYEAAQASLPATLDTLERTLVDSGGPAALVADLRAAHDTWLVHARQQIDRAASGRLDEARGVAATATGKALFDGIRDRNAAVEAWLQQASTVGAQDVVRLQQRLMAVLVVVLAVLAAVVVAGSAVAALGVSRPLARLARGTRAVAGGDLSADLPAAGAAEVRELAADVRAMRDRLTADLYSSRQALEALEQSGPAVAALRAALAPAEGRVPGLTVAARLDPAEGVLAGDWYDAIELGPTRLAVVLGDVAGHGAASAVFALRLKHSLAGALRAGLDGGQSLTQVSAELAEVPPGQFATVFIAVIDTAAGTLSHASAGHPAGLVIRGSARVPAAVRARTVRPAPGEPDDPLPAGWTELPPTGPLLSSIVSGWAWNTATCPFAPGDALLAYTDGVLESRDDGGREFGTQGIITAAQEVGEDDGDRLIGAIAAASMRFGASRPRRDDHTMVHVRRLPVG
jgi:serine phosphatase RsbU (regulator of sigma subunit)/CHASE3 domain sensor protein